MEQMIIKKPTVKNATVGLLSWEKRRMGKIILHPPTFPLFPIIAG